MNITERFEEAKRNPLCKEVKPMNLGGQKRREVIKEPGKHIHWSRVNWRMDDVSLAEYLRTTVENVAAHRAKRLTQGSYRLGKSLHETLEGTILDENNPIIKEALNDLDKEGIVTTQEWKSLLRKHSVASEEALAQAIQLTDFPAEQQKLVRMLSQCTKRTYNYRFRERMDKISKYADELDQYDFIFAEELRAFFKYPRYGGTQWRIEQGIFPPYDGERNGFSGWYRETIIPWMRSKPAMLALTM